MKERHEMILFKNCRLIPELTEGFEGTMADILVDDDVITEIEQPGNIICSEDVKVVDCEGDTVLPGFFDMHVHLAMDSLDFLPYATRSPEDHWAEVYHFSREMLKQGYTTIREAGDAYNVVKGVRDAQRKGYINVPDILSSGQILTPSERGNDTFGPMYAVCDGPMEVRKAARHQLELGNDVIKYMVTGAFLNEGGVPGELIVTEDELTEAVRIANMKGSHVMGHAHGVEGIKLAIKCGLRTVEHGSFIDDEAIEMLKNTDKTYLVPTAAIGLACLDEDSNNITDNMMDKSKMYEQQEKDCLNKAYRAGLKLGFGSDIDKSNFMAHPGMEFYARHEWYDFEYIDILKQATINSAEILGMDDRKGTIKVGKNAELVVIHGKPDIDINDMKQMPRYVYFHGELIEN